MKTYEEYKESRRRILSDNYTSKKKINIHTPQGQATICSLCGFPLAVMSPVSGGVKVNRRYWHLNYPGFFYVNLCEDSKMCYNDYRQNTEKGVI